MWYEKKGENVVKETIATSSGVREGVDRLLTYFNKRRPNPVWKRMAALDFEGDAEDIRKWFATQLPIPDRVEVLWFAFLDETEAFKLRGSTKWSCDPDDWEWWYQAEFRGKTYRSPVLVQMHALAREVENPEKVVPKGGVWELMEYLFTIGYVGLAANQAFRETNRRKLLGGRAERWVVTGFPDALYGIILGRLTQAAFEPFVQRRKRKR
jgi:hypothetical protein